MSFTKINTKQLGSNELVFTESNLLAGKGIEIIDEPVEGGIDNHTLACWHFDGDVKDVVTGLVALMGTSDTSNKKFGTGAYNTSSAYSQTNISSLGLNPSTKSATIDFWVKCITSKEDCRIGFGTYSSSNLAIIIKQNSLTLNGKNWSSAEVINGVVPGLDFNHYAIQFNKETNKASVFFNGKKVAEQTPNDLSSSSFSDFVAYSYNRKNAIDELRISDIARYNEDFTPPTKPYSVAVPTGNKVINNILDVSNLATKTDLTNYLPLTGGTLSGDLNVKGNKVLDTADKSVANGVASLDANAKIPAAQIPVDGTTITVNAEGKLVSAGGSGGGSGGDAMAVVKLTQAEYDALNPKDPSTIYAIKVEE